MTKLAIVVIILGIPDARTLGPTDKDGNGNQLPLWVDPITWANYRSLLVDDLGMWPKEELLSHFFQYELAYVQICLDRMNRYPPEEDLLRLPSLRVVESCIEFNRDFRTMIQLKRAEYPAVWWDVILGHSHTAVYPWELLRQAHESTSSYYKRCKLEELRHFLGNADYYAGRMPPHVPVWAFREKE